METKRVFDEALSTIEESEIVVLRNIQGFPVYHQDIISPYLMLFICHSGTARTLYDMQEVIFHANEVAVVGPNHIMHPIESSDDYNVTVLIHSIALREELKTKRLTHDYNKFHRRPSCTLTDEEMAHFMKGIDLVEHLCHATTQQYPLRHEMLIAQTNVLSEMLNAYRRDLDAKAIRENRNYRLFNDFCDELALRYREQHEVAFYAEKAHLTTRHFSILIKEVVGLSASDYIEQYLATQAKNLLISRPDLSVQQISYHLGFAESPSFCRFFKRHTGFTPNDFRRHA